MLIQDSVALPRAKVLIHQERPYAYDEAKGIWLFKQVGEDEVAGNLILNAGRVQMHSQCYGTSGLLTNGFNYIALTADTGSPNAGDTSLASELTGSGLGRIQGSVTLASGSGNQTTISNTFTYTGGTSQSVAKTALFTAGYPSGVMNHEILFGSARTLFTSDTLTLTFTITLG
jgi:hypothetical protein